LGTPINGGSNTKGESEKKEVEGMALDKVLAFDSI
jgi:hypothetical protein